MLERATMERNSRPVSDTRRRGWRHRQHPSQLYGYRTDAQHLPIDRPGRSTAPELVQVARQIIDAAVPAQRAAGDRAAGEVRHRREVIDAGERALDRIA